MDDLISRFRDYQIEWLTSHNDIEFCEEEEKLIIGFLKDTAESFMRENQSSQPEDWMEKNKERILQAGMEGREIEFRICGRLFAIREKAQ